MRIGPLDQRVTIQTGTEAPGAQGGRSFSWANIGETPTMWAAIVAKEGSELPEGQSQVARQTYAIRIRYRSDLTAKHRILWGSRVLNVQAIDFSEVRKGFMDLTCVETEGEAA